jgi:hypothetical protein
MMQQELARKAVVNIFWSADFKKYSETCSKIYTNIQSIMNCGIFKATTTNRDVKLTTKSTTVR